MDYLNGTNVTLSNDVTNNGNGTVTIPSGVTSFTASVPVIDDTLVESTEKAILSIGNLDGIGQIFDNDNNNQGEQAIRLISPLLRSMPMLFVKAMAATSPTPFNSIAKPANQQSVLFRQRRCDWCCCRHTQ